MSEYNLKQKRSLKSTLYFAGTLMLAEHVFAIINAYIIHGVNYDTVYAYTIMFFYVPICFSVYFISISTIRSKIYDFSNYTVKFDIAGGLILCISLIILFKAIFFFLSVLGDPKIRDLVLYSSSLSGSNQLFASLTPLITALAYIGMLYSSLLGNRKLMINMTFAFAFLEASTLSRSGFLAVFLCMLIYAYRSRITLKNYLLSVFVIFAFMSMIGLGQGRFDPETVIKILLAPVNSLSRYYAEAFALPYSIVHATRDIPSFSVIFAFPLSKFHTFLGDEGAIYFYNHFRTEFFPINIGEASKKFGTSQYSNLLHSFPSLLLATGGGASLIIGMSLWLTFSI